MRLTADEHDWLDAYRQILKGQYPSIVERMITYGSKARGDDHPDSDLDVLLIVKNEGAHLKRQLARLGSELAAMSDAVPSILAYTQDEWETRRERCTFLASRRTRRSAGLMNRIIVIAAWQRAWRALRAGRGSGAGRLV